MDVLETLTSTFGKDQPLYFLLPLLLCFIYYAIIIVSHVFLYKLNSVFAPKWLQPYFGDFFCTITACTISFQNGILRSHYGYTVYVFVVVFLTLLYRQIFKDSVSSVTANIIKYMSGSVPFGDLMLRVLIQIFAIPAIVVVNHMIWMLELMPEHVERLSQRTCTSDLNVAVALGFLIEGGAVAFDTWLNRTPITRWSSFDSCFKIFVSPLMVISGLHLTGMYLNPTLASVMTFGCKGTTPWQHVLVYWLAPVLGCILGVQLVNYCQKAKEAALAPVSNRTDSERTGRTESSEKTKKLRRRHFKGTLSKKKKIFSKFFTESTYSKATMTRDIQNG